MASNKQWHPTKNGKLTPFNVTVGSRKKVWWKCDKDIDHEWKSNTLNRILGDNNCPCCSGRQTCSKNCFAVTFPNLLKLWHPTKNGILTPFEVTSGSSKEVYWICDTNNEHHWKAKVKHIKNGSGCPICKNSKGERVIENFLKKESIIYEYQKKFKKCRYKNELPFDFYLSNHNILIEYDGKQHFEVNEFFGGEIGFKELKIRDSIKTKFAKENSISLLRIPHTEFENIEKIIVNFLTLNVQFAK